MSRYENKGNKVYDTFKCNYVTGRLGESDCDAIIMHLNHHYTLSKKKKEKNEELLEKCLDLEIENNKLKNHPFSVKGDIQRKIWGLIRESDMIGFRLWNPDEHRLKDLYDLYDLGVIQKHDAEYGLGYGNKHIVNILTRRDGGLKGLISMLEVENGL